MPTGKTEKVEKVELNEIQDEAKRNPNYIRDLIFVSLSLTERSGVPVLFLGNPGIAKTTGVRLWAEIFKYRVTTLIGTQRVAEEILGYMVNDTGERKLITYTPDWYDEILENKAAGYKTLLFVDELSQAPDNVQGAMLQLIFDRRVGGRANFLPEDCLVVAAANYKGNIPAQCGIQAATLNRFSIINVEPQDGVGLITEFLQTEEERRANIPVFAYTEVTPAISESILRNLKSAMLNLVSLYGKNDEQDLALDFKNQNLADIFEKPGPVYNFISGRTIHYIHKEMEAMVYLGIIRKEFKSVVVNVFLGLAGLGTNTFKDDEKKVDGDFNQYKIKLISRLQGAVRRAVEENMKEINSTEINYKGKSVEECISKWLLYADSAGGIIYDKNLSRLMSIIKEAYPTDTDGMEKVLSKWDNNVMLNDLQKITTLHNNLKAYQLIELDANIKSLAIIKEAYSGYLACARAEIVN
jgi:hypothetical protein